MFERKICPLFNSALKRDVFADFISDTNTDMVLVKIDTDQEVSVAYNVEVQDAIKLLKRAIETLQEESTD